MMTSEILKVLDFTKTQKPRYLEKETLFSLQIKKIHQLQIKGYFMAKSSAVEVTFKIYLRAASKAMTNRKKKRGRQQKYKHFNISKKKNAF